MNIPQEELDKLEDTSGLFEENSQEDDAMIPDQPAVEEKVSASTEEEDAVADKARIPYSRFEKVNERAIRAEERLRLLEEQSQSKAESNEDVTVPPEWEELYGDSDAAKRAYVLQQSMFDRMREETTEKTLSAIESRQTERQTEIENNLDYIEDNLAELSKNLGRDLTEAEESSVLDIQDEFTPKDDKGNYIAPLLQADKAFEIYTLRRGNATAKTTIARRKVVSITGSSSEGEGSNSAFDNYKPGASGLWRDQL